MLYRFTNPYYFGIFLSIWLGANETFAVPATDESTNAAAVRLKAHIQSPPRKKPLAASELKRLNADMQLIRKRLERYFGQGRKRLTVQQRLELRQQIQTLRTAPYPVLIFVNDAIRLNGKLHHLLATGYEALGQKRRALRHRLAQELSKFDADKCKQRNSPQLKEHGARSNGRNGATETPKTAPD